MESLSIKLLSLLVLIGVCVPLCSAYTVTCRNDKGEPVPWWIMLKTSSNSGASTDGTSGYGFVYIDNASVSTKSFRTSSVNLQSRSQALFHTLDQIYTYSSSESGYFMYNDQTPDGKTSSSKAHAKGVSMFDKDSGFWLVHSTPRYPHERNGQPYEFPDYERLYGQSYLCVSVKSPEIDFVGTQLQYMNPQIYASFFPPSLQKTLPNIDALLKGTIHTPSASNIAHFTTTDGTAFTSFAKNKNWDQDLYSALVSPTLKTGLYIETWMRPYEPSYCKPKYSFDNINVDQVTLHPADFTFPETKDHSKWAISMDGQGTYVCIGDINRNQSQWKRGGGTVCINNANLWSAFRKIITAVKKDC